MASKVYIAVGNHRSFAGIKEIVYTIHSALADHFSVELTRELKADGINIVIDEFSGLFDVAAIRKIKESYPNTRVVVVATEFITTLTTFGIQWMRTFNFFGGARDWGQLLRGMLRSSIGGMPTYMRSRYMGFVNALRYCDLVATIHPSIVPSSAELARSVAPNLKPPLMVYPQIGLLSDVQQTRLRSLPVGFVMTGTRTPHRMRTLRELGRQFRRAGWSTPLYERLSFEADRSESSSEPEADQSKSLSSLLEYNAITPRYLFNINPPQSARWAYSSPMRILRPILLGQIPVVTKRFHDHPLEQVASLWDGSSKTVIELASRQFVDRKIWLTDYLHSLQAYDCDAREANKPFVEAIEAFARSSAPPSPARGMKEPLALET